MPRIKLNRPPPVSSETVKHVVSDNAVVHVPSRNDVPSESQAGDVPTVDSFTDVDESLITRKDNTLFAEDTRRVTKHKPVKEPKEQKQCATANVAVADNVQISLPDNDDKQSHDAEQRAVSGTDNATDHRNVVSSKHRCSTSKKWSKTAVDKHRHDSAELIPRSAACNVFSKGSSENAICDSSPAACLSPETVVQSERRQSVLESDKKQTGSLLDEALKGFLVEKLAVIESERKVTDVVDCKDDIVEVVHTKPEGFSPSSKVRRRKRSRESAEQQRDLRMKLGQRDSYQTMHHSGKKYTEDDCDTGYAELYIDNWPHAYIPHGHHHISHSFRDVENVTEHNIGDEAASFRKGHRRHAEKRASKHSLHAKRQLLKLKKKTRLAKHRHQSHNLLPLERSQSGAQKTVDCIEQIRQFVSHPSHSFSHPISQDYTELEKCYENSTLKTHGRERRKSGSTSGHHHKKRKSAEDKMRRHKHVKHKHDSCKKGLQTSDNVQDMLSSKKHGRCKHKHHHRKTVLPDVQGDSMKLDKNEVHDVEPKDEGDTFIKGRSLSPLGVHHKRHTKHKNSKKPVSQSQITAQSISSLPEKIDTQYDNISSDEDFIPMKVRRNEDDEDDEALKAPHEMKLPNTIGIEQSRTKGKSAAVLQYKFLKVSRKRQKPLTDVSDANLSSEVHSECFPSANVSLEEHPVGDAVGECSQVMKDTAIDLVASDETLTRLDHGQNHFGQIGSPHEDATSASFTALEQASTCNIADGTIITTEMMRVNVDHVSDDISSERHICSTNEANAASQKSTVTDTDGDNLSEVLKSDRMLQLGETGHKETAEQTDDVTKYTSTHADSDSATRIDLSDNTSDVVSTEDVKSFCEEHSHLDADKTLASESNESQTLSEIHPDVLQDQVQEKTPTDGQDKNTEVITSVVEAIQNSSDNQSVSDNAVANAVNCPLQLNPTAGPEVVPVTSKENNKVIQTVNTAESTSNCNADDKVTENPSAPANVVMGPPLALPRSVVFKKPLMPAMRMNLRITNTSADFISSGAKDGDRHTQARNDENREEGNPVVYVVKLLLMCLNFKILRVVGNCLFCG